MHESAGYPESSAKFSDELKSKLLNLPEKGLEKCGNKVLDILWFQENVWEETVEFEIPQDQVICGMQANIFKVILKNQNGDFRTIVAKRVVPKELPSKANLQLWDDFLASVRREVNFYKDMSKFNPELFPKVYYSSGIDDEKDIMNSFYLILMEDVSENYYQDTGMNKIQAESLMQALAKFHATHWKKHLTEERGTFWVLNRRKPLGEVENADKTWKGILDRFPQFKHLFPDVENLGAALASKAQVLDDFIASNLLTQVHGDCKGWNLFFIKKSEEISAAEKSPVLFIDMQWTGVGHPLQDIAYALTTSLEADLLKDMDYFVDFYIEKLSQYQIPGLDCHKLRAEFDLVWLDYSRVILTGLWKRFSPEGIVKNATIVGPSFINRSIVHAEFIIRKVHHLLNKLDI